MIHRVISYANYQGNRSVGYLFSYSLALRRFSGREMERLMKLEIKYRFANGETACVEVSGEIAELHLEMEKERKSSDRRHFRRERYMSFDEYERYVFIDADGCGVRIDNAVDKPTFCFNSESVEERNTAMLDSAIVNIKVIHWPSKTDPLSLV